MTHTVKGFRIVNKAEIDVFLDFISEQTANTPKWLGLR